MKSRIQIFSSKRLRQIFNDLKRTSDVAKNELKISTKQLKSYLTLFEQLMANHLSQLSSVRDFFSIPFSFK